MNVLVVDDEPSICWGFQQLLGQEGFHVLVAGSAEAGLELARKNVINLVLLDVRLPGLSGLEALKSFRQSTNDAPVIVMTAFGDLETAVKAVEQGASDYLNKPFCLDDALSVCQRALRRSLPNSSTTGAELTESTRRAGGVANSGRNSTSVGAKANNAASLAGRLRCKVCFIKLHLLLIATYPF